MKKYVAVAGNIGVGKSTLVKLLCNHMGWQPFYEPEVENPYLADFYRDMRAFGKGYEAFYERVARAGVHFTRFDQDLPDGGLQVSQHNGQLKLTTTDLYTGLKPVFAGASGPGPRSSPGCPDRRRRIANPDGRAARTSRSSEGTQAQGPSRKSGADRWCATGRLPANQFVRSVDRGYCG